MTLQVSHLGKRFAGARGVAREALRGVDLRVSANEFVSLVGASGCGKSTLLRIVGGLETASEGHVRLNGRPVSGPTPDVAMVFQEPRLMPWLTVRENARLALLGRPLTEQNASIDDALAKVGLAAFADALPHQLSGGMAQRAALARALVRNPSVLLLDEPFAALDSFMRTKLQDHLRELHARENLTVLFVTHDSEEAIVLSDRIAVMAGPPGRIVREFAVDLPRPRRRGDAEVQSLKEEIVGAIEASGAKLTA